MQDSRAPVSSSFARVPGGRKAPRQKFGASGFSIMTTWRRPVGSFPFKPRSGRRKSLPKLKLNQMPQIYIDIPILFAVFQIIFRGLPDSWQHLQIPEKRICWFSEQVILELVGYICSTVPGLFTPSPYVKATNKLFPVKQLRVFQLKLLIFSKKVRF